MTKFINDQLELIAPAGIELKVGDTVQWANDLGVTWTNKIIGFNTTREYNQAYKKFVHLDTESYWFPHSADTLTKISKVA